MVVLFFSPNLNKLLLLVQLIVVMASHCYLVGSSGELFVEYLVRNCALTDQDRSNLQMSKEVLTSGNANVPIQYKRLEVYI